MLRLTPLVALPAVAAMLFAGAAAAQQPPGFLESLEVRLVNPEVSVTDRQGNPVDGLSASDFTPLEDGKRPGSQRPAVDLVVPTVGASAFVSGDLEVGSP